MKNDSPEREKIFVLYGKLIAGKQWKEIEEEAKISRQWFDKKRVEYGLPSPAEVRRAKKEKENPLPQGKNEILKRRKKENYFTMTEAAEKIGITVGVLAVQQRKGKIKGEKEGVHIFIHADEIDRYINEHRRTSPEDANFLTVQEAVALSKRTIGLIYSDVHNGKIASVHRGSTVLIEKDSFMNWVNEKNRHKKIISDKQVIQAYRKMAQGETWDSLPLSERATYSEFDRRRIALHLPSISYIRKQKEASLV